MAGSGTQDVVVIGAGLVGLATAMALLESRPGLRVTVLEKEQAVGAHQSGHNSGVIHAGLYYKPGSLKARFCTAGRLAMMEFADAHQIPYRQTGKLVVATRASELPGSPAWPSAAGRTGWPSGRSARPRSRTSSRPCAASGRCMSRRAASSTTGRSPPPTPGGRQAGGQVLCGHGLLSLARTGGGWVAETAGGPVRAKAVVACAGLQADRIAAMTGQGSSEYRIVPFRGDYYTFRPAAAALVRGLVYPVPDPAFPFLGVHFTRGVDGTLHAGPNAVPALAREGYGRPSVNGRDLLDACASRACAGWPVLRPYRRPGDLARPGQAGVPGRDAPVHPVGHRAGYHVRAVRHPRPVPEPSGALVDDFLIEEAAGVIHVLNAPSPAATASIVIGRHIASTAAESFTLLPAGRLARPAPRPG